MAESDRWKESTEKFICASVSSIVQQNSLCGTVQKKKNRGGERGQISAYSQRLRQKHQVFNEDQNAFPWFYLMHKRDGTVGQ
jgi:hypothetical protein